jgi:hypothetical protein
MLPPLRQGRSAIRGENMQIFLLVLNVGNGMEWMGLGVAGMIIARYY